MTEGQLPPAPPAPSEVRAPKETGATSRPASAWIYDLDGTTLTNNRVDPGILKFAIARAKLGESTCFLSARDDRGVVERALDPLEQTLRNLGEDVSLLRNFYAISEAGGDGYRYSLDGTRERIVDDARFLQFAGSNFIPKLYTLMKGVAGGKALTGEEFPTQIAHVNENKDYSLTLEQNEGTDQKEWEEVQERYISYFESVLREWPTIYEDYFSDGNMPPDEIVRMDDEAAAMIINKTPKTVTIQRRDITKAEGAKQLIDWLSERGIKPAMYQCFGDTYTDLLVKEGVESAGGTAEFYFVGDDPGEPKEHVEVIGGNTQGTLSVLSRFVKEAA